MFGMGQITGIDLAGEAKGLVPSTTWKMANRGEIWYPGETLSVAIGQGYVSATPLQMADLLAAVAVNGKRFRPTVRLGVWDSMEDGLLVDEPDQLPTVVLADNTFKVLKSALTGVVWDRKGTARSARSKRVTIAGKTGTAQVVSMAKDEDKVDEKDIPIRHRDHAWFAAFAPVEDPRIAVAVLVEHGGHGGSAAAPVARRVIEAYINAHEESPHGEDLYRALEELHREREAT
jgi:penicillin-binding protein 2